MQAKKTHDHKHCVVICFYFVVCFEFFFSGCPELTSTYMIQDSTLYPLNLNCSRFINNDTLADCGLTDSILEDFESTSDVIDYIDNNTTMHTDNADNDIHGMTHLVELWPSSSITNDTWDWIDCYEDSESTNFNDTDCIEDLILNFKGISDDELNDYLENANSLESYLPQVSKYLYLTNETFYTCDPLYSYIDFEDVILYEYCGVQDGVQNSCNKTLNSTQILARKIVIKILVVFGIEKYFVYIWDVVIVHYRVELYALVAAIECRNITLLFLALIEFVNIFITIEFWIILIQICGWKITIIIWGKILPRYLPFFGFRLVIIRIFWLIIIQFWCIWI